MFTFEEDDFSSVSVIINRAATVSRVRTNQFSELSTSWDGEEQREHQK